MNADSRNHTELAVPPIDLNLPSPLQTITFALG